jgi:uncharacterized membrane protein YdfJ with MMPL/SSD domain
MSTTGVIQPRASDAARGAVASPLGRLGSWSFRHRRLVMAAWLLVLIAVTVTGRMTGSAFRTDLAGGNTPSQRAAAFLREHFPAQAGDAAQVVFATAAPVTSAADRARVNRTLAGLAGLPHVASVRGPFSGGPARLVSPDGHLAYGVVQFDSSGDALPLAAIQRVITRARGAAAPGFSVQLGGAPIQKTENPSFGASEAAGILAAVVILLLAFGSVIAMALPIATAIAAVATTFGVLDAVSHVLTVPSFGPELAALAALALLAVPFASLRLAFTDAGTSPASYTSRQAYDLIANGFGPGANGPLLVAVKLPGPGAKRTMASLRAGLARQPDVSFVTPPDYNPAGTAAVLTVIPRTSPQDARTAALVQRLRQAAVPRATAGTGVTALIGGQTAASIDTSTVISSHLAAVGAFVIALSVLLLIAAFRSVLVPLVSAGLTLASTAAAYGVMVAVFQWGWLGSGIDNGATAPVDPWIPLMLFALLFGFSMDHQVFLISRIREQRLGGATDSGAVANGLATTGRVITSAATIMICVFAAFVLGDLRVLRVIGLGMAVAIFLDATVVRMAAMPSALHLLGRAAWWFPRWLDRAIPAFLAETQPEPPLPFPAIWPRPPRAALTGPATAASPFKRSPSDE